jgi:ABC-type multidrug transport system fused ATPase/permease subunit
MLWWMSSPTSPEITPAADPFDPPSYGLGTTSRRLTALSRAQGRLMVEGLGYAVVYTILSLAIPALVARAIDRSIVTHKEALAPLLVAIGVLAALRLWVNYRRRYTTSRIGIEVEAQMREKLYDSYLKFPRAFYDRHATGQVLSRATNDLYPVRYFIGFGLILAFQSTIMIAGTAVVLGITDWKLTLLSGIPLPAIMWVAWHFGQRVSPISHAVQARKGDLTDAANEAVVGIEMVQAFGREEIVRERFGDHATAIQTEMIRQADVEAVHLPPIFYLPSLSVAIVLFVGGRQVIDGTLSYGDLALFIQLLLQIVWPLEALGYILDLGQRALASAGRSFAWLEQVPLLSEPAAEEASAIDSSTPADISFNAVRFAYGGETETLRSVDLRIDAGEIVAVCGRTGAGKSTLLSLLARQYDPSVGSIRIQGVDLRSALLSDLRGAVALVTQRPILFSDTLRNNLLAGRPDADSDTLLRACEQAGLGDFVAGLPDGLETVIGERGVNLSGGQRQRTALARALLAESSVVILDDPLSAVDTETEAEILSTLREALAGRTTVLAAQRFSTLAIADRIVVMEDGRITQSGTSAELLAVPGAFRNLFAEETVVGNL